MPKVVTGSGLQEFIQSGKHEVVAADKPAKEAPALEVKKETPVAELSAPKEEPKTPEPEAKPEKDDGLEAEDLDLSEVIRKKIGKKHRAMKEAQEAAADAEAFAKGQYDRARLAEERAAELAKALEDARKSAAPAEPERKKPSKEDAKYSVNGQFDWETFSADQAEFVAESKLRAFTQKQAEDRIAAERAEVAKKFKEKADKIDGFHEKMASTSVWFPNAVLEYITESDEGPEIAVYLADHPDEAETISKLRPIKAIAEIGKLVKGFGKAEPVKTPPAPPPERGGAPPPITPISGMGSGTVNTDPAKMSFRELREFERAKRKR